MTQEEIKLLKSRYETLICDLSGGKVSKYDTSFPVVEMAINEAQQRIYYDIVKEDIQNIMDGGGTILDIQIYLNRL